MGSTGYIGQTLDGKYQIERELGRGGMGTVYLATHVGTERPVAVKIISPQYMQRGEFVERFRREARAAGRLRHPNVVNVTDFGFADAADGRVAYLVMEYLDGCTLGEILEEERNLPVSWTLDILEQVCSAVHEAHTQGIIHRDLKPDNIWLEPNLRGGYTVKVLDFGIAKLEESMAADAGTDDNGLHISDIPVSRETIAGSSNTIAEKRSDTIFGEASTIALMPESGTMVSEAGTLIQDTPTSEDKTAIFGDQPTGNGEIDSHGTHLATGGDRHSGLRTPEAGTVSTSSDLTRVGAVLGTPLYMSPEQCRGEKLDPRSDVYSLGVIAYQMLSGDTPFAGDFTEVMESHKTLEPVPLRAKKARRKMKRAVHRALAKDPGERPPTAEAFASEMRARSEGIFGLLRRSLVIYSEHLPKFVILTTFFSLPVIVLTLALIVTAFLQVSGSIGDSAAQVASGLIGVALGIVSIFCSYLIVGTITWVVAQYLAIPLRPVRVRPALKEARQKWKTFAGTGMLSTLMQCLAFVAGSVAGALVALILSLVTVPFYGWTMGQLIFSAIFGLLFVGPACWLVADVSWKLVSPVVMMENLRGRAALRRSMSLVKRSVVTAAAAAIIMFLIPGVLAGSISLFINFAAKALDPKSKAPTNVEKTEENGVNGVAPVEGQPQKPANGDSEKSEDFDISFGGGPVKVKDTDKDMQTQVKRTLLQSINQVIWLPIQILVISFSSIIVALLYIKTRLSGGETTMGLMERFEDDDRPRKKWQERVRQRLIQSGRVTSKS